MHDLLENNIIPLKNITGANIIIILNTQNNIKLIKLIISLKYLSNFILYFNIISCSAR